MIWDLLPTRDNSDAHGRRLPNDAILRLRGEWLQSLAATRSIVAFEQIMARLKRLPT
jgi:hypothetical protein